MRSIIVLFSFVFILGLALSSSSAQAQEPCDCQAIGARLQELQIQITHREVFIKMAEIAESSGSKQDKENITNMKSAAERLRVELGLAEEAAKFCGCFK